MSQYKDIDLTRTDAVMPDNAFKGYTLEELRYRRAYVAARKDMEKERLLYNFTTLRERTIKNATNTVRRVTSAIPLVNYGLMAWGIGSKVISAFRKKKKKEEKMIEVVPITTTGKHRKQISIPVPDTEIVRRVSDKLSSLKKVIGKIRK